MTSLEDLTVGALIRGILDRPIRVVQVEWHGADALTLTYTDESGRPGQELLYRDDEDRLTVEGRGRAWSMDADGHLFRLVSEAKRISLATCSTRTWRCRSPRSTRCHTRSTPSI